MVSRDFTLTTVDEVTLAGRHWPSSDTPSERGQSATVVITHGFAASKDDAAVLAVTHALRARGHAVLTYDGRGQGDSDGLCTLGDAERHDVAAAVAAAREH